MGDQLSDLQWLTDLLRETTVVQDAQVGLETEVYYDLHISGFDLDDVLATAAERCGVADLTIPSGRYAPGEPGDWFDWLFKAPHRRRYKSLTVSMLLQAMREARANVSQMGWRASTPAP